MSTLDKICSVGASKSSDNGVCEVNNMLQNMSMSDNMDNDLSVCANCGKEGEDVNNVCNKCKQVKYCNAACKKKHRHKHKKDCEEYQRLAAERAAELHDIELFRPPPPKEDCPICFLHMPYLGSGSQYMTCCGKLICNGCLYAPVYDDQGNKVDDDKQNACAFCRVVAPKTDEETVERLNKRVEAGDAVAIFTIGCDYRDGANRYPQDYAKALELFHRAGVLGYAAAYIGIGLAYDNGNGVEVDKKKAIYYYELAAMGGSVNARHNLGWLEENAGNADRALKHHMIAISFGDADSLERIKELYSSGHASKDEYTRALKVYQTYLAEIKSAQRDKAAAEREECRYY